MGLSGIPKETTWPAKTEVNKLKKKMFLLLYQLSYITGFRGSNGWARTNDQPITSR